MNRGVFALVDLLPARTRGGRGVSWRPVVGSIPASITPPSRFSTVGVRLRDHADAPAVVDDQAVDHLRGGVGLAGSRRSVHRQVRRVQVEHGGGDVGDSCRRYGAAQRRCGCGARGAAGCRPPRCRAVAAIRRRRRPRSIRSIPAAARCRHGRSRGQRERQLVKSVAVAAHSLDDDHLGGRARIVGLDHLGPPGGAPIRIVGHARRGRRLVEREHVRRQVARAPTRRSAAPAAAACAPAEACASRRRPTR